MSNDHTGIRARFAFGATALVLSNGAFAQVFIDYEPVASIPTLSSAMMVVMALLLAAMAFRMLKTRPGHSGRLLAALMTVGALALTAGGASMFGDAQAIGPSCTDNFENPAGGVVCVDPGSPVQNQTGVTQRITRVFCVGDLVRPSNISAQNGGAACTVGALVNPGASCFAEAPLGLGCSFAIDIGSEG